MADLPFVNFAFRAAGATASRTMPDRLAEIKNVVDFGADPTGGADSTAAIQAAVDSESGANRGVIYFPFGSYKVSAPITFDYNGDLSICFRGDLGTSIFTNPAFAGYVFDRNNVDSGSPNNTSGLRIFEKLNIQSSHTSSSSGCVRIGSTNGASFIDCVFSGQTCVTTEDGPGDSSQNILFQNCLFTGPNASPYIANGIVIGGSGVIAGCDFHNLNAGVRAYGSGLHVCGGRAENNNTAYLFGLDSADADQGASGFSITSFSTEGNGTAIYLAGTCSAFLIGPGGSQGHDASNSGYPLGAGASEYGLRLGADCSAGLIHNFSAGSVADVASVSIAAASSRANIFFLQCNAIQSGGGGVSWELPNNAYTAQFKYCNTNPIWTYSQLPSGGNVLEGDEFSISDGNSATWGANVTAGSGGNAVLVRWNGSNWTVVAK